MIASNSMQGWTTQGTNTIWRFRLCRSCTAPHGKAEDVLLGLLIDGSCHFLAGQVSSEAQSTDSQCVQNCVWNVWKIEKKLLELRNLCGTLISVLRVLFCHSNDCGRTLLGYCFPKWKQRKKVVAGIPSVETVPPVTPLSLSVSICFPMSEGTNKRLMPGLLWPQPSIPCENVFRGSKGQIGRPSGRATGPFTTPRNWIRVHWQRENTDFSMPTHR